MNRRVFNDTHRTKADSSDDQGVTSPSNGSSPSKKDAPGIPQSPLGKLLEGAGALVDDGSDKFFGMENVGA